MRLRSLPLLACAAVGALLLVAPAAEAQQPAAGTPEMAYRKATMNGIRYHREALAALVEGRVTHPDHAAYHASALRGLAMMAGDVFPSGSHGEGSRALPAIWENGSAFTVQVQGFQAAATALDEAARSGNGEALTAALGAFGRTCASCHNEFRGPAN
jgi:cytochrome c556